MSKFFGLCKKRKREPTRPNHISPPADPTLEYCEGPLVVLGRVVVENPGPETRVAITCDGVGSLVRTLLTRSLPPVLGFLASPLRGEQRRVVEDGLHPLLPWLCDMLALNATATLGDPLCG